MVRAGARLKHVDDPDDPARDVLARGDRYARSPCIVDRERRLAVIANFGDTRLYARALREVIVVTNRIGCRVAITMGFEEVLAAMSGHKLDFPAAQVIHRAYHLYLSLLFH
jgi:hypothetical protein